MLLVDSGPELVLLFLFRDHLLLGGFGDQVGGHLVGIDGLRPKVLYRVTLDCVELLLDGAKLGGAIALDYG